MANQRKKGKKKIGIWMSEIERTVAKKLAKGAGMSVSDYLKQEITRQIEHNNEHHAEIVEEQKAQHPKV